MIIAAVYRTVSTVYILITEKIQKKKKPLKRQPLKMVTLKQFVGKLATNCLSVFDNFVGLALKWLRLKDV